MSGSVIRVALGVALVLCIPLVGMQFSDSVVWTASDFVTAGVLLAVIGVVLELAVKRSGSRALAIGVAVLGLASALFGEGDDAPGLVLLGLVLMGSACALFVRRPRSS